MRLPTRPEQLSVAAAAAAFLAKNELAANSRRVYAGSLRCLADGLGDDLPVAALPAPQVRVCAPATWNRELATLRSVVRWWTGRGWLEADPTSGLARRKTSAVIPCGPVRPSFWPCVGRHAYRRIRLQRSWTSFSGGEPGAPQHRGSDMPLV